VGLRRAGEEFAYRELRGNVTTSPPEPITHADCPSVPPGTVPARDSYAAVGDTVTCTADVTEV
jgi:hypothetical protein